MRLPALALLSICCLLPRGGLAQQVDFAGDIQPIFKRSCTGCHGPTQQLGQLRLDSRQALLHGGASQGVVAPGDPDASPLYQRIAGLGAGARMPMGGELPSAEIDLIKRWIEQGATWNDSEDTAAAPAQKHWAFTPPTRPSLPAVSSNSWPRNPIDHFVLAKLESEGLQPSPEAPPATLLRRAGLDVVGLPPTIDTVDRLAGRARLRDRDYSQEVDRLLASPHYGERWGRLWLDAARYADSDGFEKDKPRQVWFYRDWVINALNRDLGYDQFVIEQIAGDLLPNATQDQRVATGFLRNSMLNEEGGIDPEQFRMEAMFDRVDAIGKSILGLTIQCAQCHNHKFDPLTQKEYYQVLGFLNNSHESSVTVYTHDERRQRDTTLAAIRAVEDELMAGMPDWPRRLTAWEQQRASDQPEWRIFQPTVRDMSTGGQKYEPLEDGSFIARGYAPTKHRVQMTWETTERDITAMRLELMMHPDLPHGGPGRSIVGTAALSEFEVEIAPASDPENRQKVTIASATADFTSPEKELAAPYLDKSDDRRVTGPIAFAIDGNKHTAWGTDAGPGRRNQARKAVFGFEKPIGHEGGSVITVYLDQQHGGWNSNEFQSHNLGRMRLSTTSETSAQADTLPTRVRELLATPVAERSPDEQRAVFSYWRTTVSAWDASNERIDQLWQQHPEGITQLVLNERDQPRMTHVLERGNFLKPAEAVQPGVPQVLHPLPEGPRDRLMFARWLVDDRSPTAARVIVNRIWQAYFGQGLITTPEDLGSRGQAPSHPELLDWLAVELVDNDWSLKHVHRLILESATYRQSSNATPELIERDPYNVLLARGARFRVDAEIVRDIALQASGLLNPAVGGPPVYPPAPEFLFLPPASYGTKTWPTETGEDRYRRALYGFRYRSVPDPMLDVFDAPKADTSCIRRSRANTPLQALATLNEPLFLEAARALALQVLESEIADTHDGVNYAFRRCVARAPSSAESDELVSFFNRQRKRFESGELDAWAMLDTSPSFRNHLPGGASPSEAAAWTALSRVLLNLDETITKE
jgi:hypothetical protein